MTIFDNRRLTQATIQLDVDGLRRGFYSDKYFANIVHILQALNAANYTFSGHSPRELPVDPASLDVGDIVVEAQVFNRHEPQTLIAGTDVALAMLRHATGYFDGDQFVETYPSLEVDAVHDGVFTRYGGSPMHVQPVLKIRGRYRDFALLETPILGVLSRASRVATNVHEALKVSGGKPVLFFPARFDLPAVQMIDGYAYYIAVERYNADTGYQLTPLASTDAQAAWWGGRGGGTIPHALIACFLADTAETMVAFARHMPPEVIRVALVDFNNNCVDATLDTMRIYWQHYQAALQAGDLIEQQRWTLYGVRPDTSSDMRDASLPPDAPKGVSAVLVRTLRAAIDEAWRGWDLPSELQPAARAYCANVKIVVSGGFNADKIARFEADDVPVSTYAVGSSFLRNDSYTNTDFTMDIVRVLIDGQWVDMAKVGRQACDNPDLALVDLRQL